MSTKKLCCSLNWIARCRCGYEICQRCYDQLPLIKHRFRKLFLCGECPTGCNRGLWREREVIESMEQRAMERKRQGLSWDVVHRKWKKQQTNV